MQRVGTRAGSWLDRGHLLIWMSVTLVVLSVGGIISTERMFLQDANVHEKAERETEGDVEWQTKVPRMTESDEGTCSSCMSKKFWKRCC